MPERPGAPENVTTAELPAGTSGEPRWPMAGAVITAMLLTVLLPDEVRLGPPWLLPSIEGLLLLVIVFSDPGRISRRSAWLRAVSVGLVAVLALAALWSTVLLVDQLVNGGAITQSAEELLDAGLLVWVSNNLAFSLLYAELDDGGPAARAWQPRQYPDLAFPQELSPGIAPEGWKPRFIDYLYLGFTNATAFSPTDVMPLVPWAKITMAAQSLISLVILSLVVARAVNVLS